MLKLDIARIQQASYKLSFSRELGSSRVTKDILTTSRPRVQAIFTSEQVHELPRPLSYRVLPERMHEEHEWSLSDSESVEYVSRFCYIETYLRKSQAELTRLKARVLRLVEVSKDQTNELFRQIDHSQRVLESM